MVRGRILQSRIFIETHKPFPVDQKTEIVDKIKYSKPFFLRVPNDQILAKTNGKGRIIEKP